MPASQSWLRDHRQRPLLRRRRSGSWPSSGNPLASTRSRGRSACLERTALARHDAAPSRPVTRVRDVRSAAAGAAVGRFRQDPYNGQVRRRHRRRDQDHSRSRAHLKRTGEVNAEFWKALQAGKIIATTVVVKKPVPSRSPRRQRRRPRARRHSPLPRSSSAIAMCMRGAGPNGWDCSGLSMKAWKAAGVKLPHCGRKAVPHRQEDLQVQSQERRPGLLLPGHQTCGAVRRQRQGHPRAAPGQEGDLHQDEVHALHGRTPARLNHQCERRRCEQLQTTHGDASGHRRQRVPSAPCRL